MTEDQYHDWDAAYVLGMLSSEDRRAFEQHLTTCAACSAAVAELAGMPGILGTLSRDEAVSISAAADSDGSRPHDPDLVTRLAVAAGKRRKRSRLVVAFAGAAAAAVLLIGGFAIGSATDSPGQPALVAMTQVHPGFMTADISVSKKSWGTRFDWSCHYLNTAAWNGRAPTYELVATAKDGAQTVVATWTAHGPTTKDLVAASSLPTSSITHLEIRLAGATQPLTTLDL